MISGHGQKTLNLSEAGHGLGLAVAQRMAGLMDSRVVLHPASAHGAGAVFSITLAQTHIDDATGAAPADPTSVPRTALPANLHVLMVDDDPAA